MNVTIIGTGNVATVLGRLMVGRGHTVQEVYGRNRDAVTDLAALLQARAVTELSDITTGFDLYLIAVADEALPLVAQALRLKDEIVVHTAGAVSRQLLEPCSMNHGVMYPLQSLLKQDTSVPEIPFLVDGADEFTTEKIEAFARTLGTMVTRAGDEERRRYHLNAVLVNNFVNMLYQYAYNDCAANGLDFNMLHPIIMETANRSLKDDPAVWQTGPALRHDVSTMKRHMKMIDDRRLKRIYRVASKGIMNLSK
jgi:predicted short-subunit dehydrogenase-like oxidoreductase (DUF2520 family)